MKDQNTIFDNLEGPEHHIYQDSELHRILEAALKKTMAYAFDKGYANDHKPDQEKANAIRDEAIAAILANYTPNAKIVEAIGEDMTAHTNDKKLFPRLYYRQQGYNAARAEIRQKLGLTESI